MLRHLVFCICCLGLASAAMAQSPPEMPDVDFDRPWSIAIHGGAGVIERGKITPEKEAEIREKLENALDEGAQILDAGGSAMDAITVVIMNLENDPNFNAGKGAVFTWEGVNEMDASIMDGSDLSAGAVAGVHTTKNPILLARAVKDKSPHVFLSGKGADQFSIEQGLEQAPPEYFATQFRRDQLEKLKAKKLSALDVEFKYGTVGAVALDRSGNMAAGTSTGGMTGKRWGRIGDSPVIGAGTYADNRACAISATGSGEYFIRLGVAHEICSRIRYRWREALKEAQLTVPKDADGNYTYIIHASEFALDEKEIQQIADDVIEELGGIGGDGGIIFATPWGQSGYSFNTPGMYRGKASSDSPLVTAIYGDE